MMKLYKTLYRDDLIITNEKYVIDGLVPEATSMDVFKATREQVEIINSLDYYSEKIELITDTLDNVGFDLSDCYYLTEETFKELKENYTHVLFNDSDEVELLEDLYFEKIPVLQIWDNGNVKNVFLEELEDVERVEKIEPVEFEYGEWVVYATLEKEPTYYVTVNSNQSGVLPTVSENSKSRLGLEEFKTNDFSEVLEFFEEAEEHYNN